MRVRSVAIVEAFQIKSLSDEDMVDLVQWIFTTGGGNVLTEKHGSHMHIKGRGFDFEVYDATNPIWLVYSDGSYFAFTDEEFQKSYEPVDKGKIEARVTVQTQTEFVKGALGTVFQALVNSGLSRDQALDGLVEIQATGIGFYEKSELARSRLFADVSPRCMRCDPAIHNKYPHNHHETSEHDQWYKYHLNQEVNDV